jgi:predicted TPR repeat methyltransferase
VKEDDLEQLGKDFIRCAATHQGSLERFLQKLDVLRAMTKQGVFTFSPESLEAYLQAYAAANYPAVSHSEQYRAAYRPAYRVILQALIYP